MRFKIVLSILFCFFLACKKKQNTNNQLVKKYFYPHSQYFEKGSYITYDNDVIFERKSNRDSLDEIYFLKFKNDSIIFNTKEIELPAFYKDYLKFEKEFFLLNTAPMTLGKNRKSTDLIVKYDEKLNIIKKRDLDIPKYPSGNSFIVGDDNKLFYISDWFEFNKKTKLVVSQINDSLSIVNQKKITSKERGYLYNPIECKFINDVGIVIVSEISEFEGNSRLFKIDMLDLDLNLKWSCKLEADLISYLGYSNSEKSIFLVSNKANDISINLWNITGDKTLKNIDFKNKIISATSNDNDIYILSNAIDNQLRKISFSGKKIEENIIPYDINKAIKNTGKLIYKNNQLFIADINNRESLFFIERIKL